MEKGGISVSTENIFPVIKRWLYSDKDIFVREVVSNACDAITKYKRLVSLGEANGDNTDYKVTVAIDKEKKTITVTDNGIGMSDEEVKKYINQIALSGALEFIDKYESKEEGGTGIIGHFGLGFYSVFMVASRAELITKSYTDAPAVHWTCDESGQFSMKESKKKTRGTEVILHITEEEIAYLDAAKIREILEKYCAFMPYPVIMLPETTDKDAKEQQINDTQPLWQKNPSDVTEEEYKEFYHKVFHDYRDPLLWVHINADYPLNFKGILYFPEFKNGFEPPETKVNLYYNQVFVADNIKEIIPEYLYTLHGVVDCPLLPLNVSRSYLQTNTYVQKVSAHIVKKIADRINALFTNDRANLERVYEGLAPVIEYACMNDGKFYDRVKANLLFHTVDGKFVTVSEYLDGKDEGEVFYTVDKDTHNYYVNLYTQKNKKILLMERVVETQFAQFLESKNEKIKFKRIDSVLDSLDDNKTENKEEREKLATIFSDAAGKKSEEIAFVTLGEEDAAALITVPEEDRRRDDMMRMYGMTDNRPAVSEKLSVNPASKAIQRLLQLSEEKQKLAAKQLYLSALLLSRKLTKEEMDDYIKLNNALIEAL